MQIAHALTAAGDALNLVAATVLTSGLVYLGVGMACLAFVGAAVVVRIGGGR
jgi:hypothetical protein